jgi:hypothetical protein
LGELFDIPAACARREKRLPPRRTFTVAFCAKMNTPATMLINIGMSQMLSNTEYLSHIREARSARRSYHLLGVASGTSAPFFVAKDMGADQPAADIVLDDEGLTMKNLNPLFTR